MQQCGLPKCRSSNKQHDPNMVESVPVSIHDDDGVKDRGDDIDDDNDDGFDI